MDARFRADRILIRPKSGIDPAMLTRFHTAQKAKVVRRFEKLGDIQVLRLPKQEAIRGLIAKYMQSGLVEYAEPDYRVHLAVTSPNDPKFVDGTLWPLNNTGQNGGAADADIDAPEAWDTLTCASNMIVAVVDTGVRYTHEDLAPNMWVNPQDGSHGVNVLNGSNDPSDDSGHGTLIAGILGAKGNNGRGVAGVAWQVQIMACKFADNSGGAISDAIACIEYARTNGAQVINASWGTYEFSLSLSNAIYAARDAGIIVVAAAGNDAFDDDVRPYYPASLPLDNVVAVAATTRSDELYSLSNIGATNVHLAAPGREIYSTCFSADDAYSTDEGTSMAAAFVSGACALLRARYATETHQQVISRLLAGTDSLPSLAGKCVTGGRLNLRKALGPADILPPRLTTLPTADSGLFQFRLSGQAERAYIIEVTANLEDWMFVATKLTAPDGTFVFTDKQTAERPQRYFRAYAAP